MPELPEAETIARGLAGPLNGRTVQEVRVLWSDVVEPSPDVFMARLRGGTFHSAARRGKNVVLPFTSAEGEPLRWVVNLGMSGRLLFRSAHDPSPSPTHPAVEVELGQGDQVIYHDPRRFGRLRVLGEAEFQAWSDTLGPEPLGPDFTAARLARDMERSRSPIRSWLLDQRRVAGVGNIYAVEALHRSGVHPALPANQVGSRQAPRLHAALVTVLKNAIEARGTTLRDYRTAQGWEGSYGAALLAYGREGEPCHGCGSAIERVVLSNRSAFFCPRCQPLGDGS